MVASVLLRLGTGAVAQESGHVLVLIQLWPQVDVGQVCASYRHWHWQLLRGCCRRLQVCVCVIGMLSVRSRYTGFAVHADL